jgi:hypothetical protein
MKKPLAILLLTLLIISCKQQVNTNKDVQIKEEINAIVNNWHKAATNANFENYFSKMDSVSVFIGTDASENWTKTQFEKFSKPYFDNGKAWDFKTLERNIYISKNKDLVWFDELLNTWMGTCRGSGVIEKNQNQWKIKHYVLSVSIPNESINKVIKVKREIDSIFLQKFK